MDINEVSRVVSLSLSYLTEAQRISANNIANANSGSREAKHVSFEQLLSAVPMNKELSHQTVSQVMNELSQKAQPERVNLAQEVAASHEYAMKYDAMVGMLNKQLSLYRLVISGRNQ
ncbi:hypothetical protein [Pleionea sp. CnH1-48]|uniref:hypothetical protein n=1 Tax=Pleionea sp. CnH1-48 TaxID=2954494 RepID=UPI0020970798|nr:hypothetical protein [Pleionea sp. CnH1-48]MCO7223716.1 hypothetical protein [Pleionea sp. CnH1-48]